MRLTSILNTLKLRNGLFSRTQTTQWGIVSRLRLKYLGAKTDQVNPFMADFDLLECHRKISRAVISLVFQLSDG